MRQELGTGTREEGQGRCTERDSTGDKVNKSKMGREKESG